MSRPPWCVVVDRPSTQCPGIDERDERDEPRDSVRDPGISERDALGGADAPTAPGRDEQGAR